MSLRAKSDPGRHGLGAFQPPSQPVRKEGMQISIPAPGSVDEAGQKLMAYGNQLHMGGKRREAEGVYKHLCGLYPKWGFPVFSLGTLYTEADEFGLAIPLLSHSIQLDPKNKQAYNNLGASLRAAGHHHEAVRVLKLGLDFDPESVPIFANLSGCYVNNGTPDQAVGWARKGLALDPDHPQCSNHYALGNLERGEWGEGFDHWEKRINLPGWVRRDTGNLPRWEGEERGCVAVIGEQGIGDEIMFCSILADAAAKTGHLAVEVTPRLMPVMQEWYTGPKNIRFYPSWEALVAAEKPEAWTLMGGLGRLFRRSMEDCPGTPYIAPPKEMTDEWRGKLGRLGSGPHIGLAWRGGTPKTHSELRCMDLATWKPIYERNNATFVSVQYGNVGIEAGASGLPHWAELTPDFLRHTALIAACDLIITVCQTAVHQAGSMGVPCWCLTPSKPAWRYLADGVCGNRMPWYNSVRQYRQKKDDWQTVIEQVAHDLSDFT